jgi:hypothetical protein
MKKYLAFIALLILPFLVEGQQLHHFHKDLPCVDKTFQVYVHVVIDSLGNTNISEEQLRNDIEGASMYFEPICIDFEICKIDSINNYAFDSIAPEPKEDGRLKALLHEKNRINFYYIAQFEDPGKCGHASLGGISGSESGLVFIKKGCGSGTVAHELGHLFGLSHTFEGNGTEWVNGDDCETEGDGLCDTPSDPFVPGDDVSEYVADDCEFISMKRDTFGMFYQPDVGNVMSYYPCTCGFTWEQYKKMANSYLNANFKMW